MFKNTSKLTLLYSICSLISSNLYANENIEDDIRVTTNPTPINTSQSNDDIQKIIKVLSFPEGLANLTDDKHRHRRINKNYIESKVKLAMKVKSCSLTTPIYKGTPPSNYCYLKHARTFQAAGAEFGVEPALLAAIAMTETKMNETEPPNGVDCAPASAKFTGHITKKGCLGMMQFGPQTFEEMSKERAMRGRITTLSDALNANISIPAAALYLNKLGRYLNSFKSLKTFGLPKDSIIYKIRAYNGGAGNVKKVLERKLSYKYQNFENFEYLYSTIINYVVFGGKNLAQFQSIFNGQDPYLLAHGINVGKGNLDSSLLGEINLSTPYVRMPPVCSTDTHSPLKSKGALPVISTFGERYDHHLGKNRKNTFTQFSAEENTPVLAISKGTVLSSEKSNNGLGQVLKVKNEDGSVWVYATLKNIQVENGAIVEAGTHLAYVSADNKEKMPLLTLGYFKDGKKSLALEETNTNFDDPLSHYCGQVDIPSDFTADTGALSEMVTEVKTELSNSQAGALEALINNRLSNAQWLNDISTMSEPRLYAELSYIKAIRLQIRTLGQQIEDRTAILKAAKVALLREQAFKNEANQLNRAVKAEQ